MLGRDAWGTGPACDCAIDEVKLYERALDLAEVQAAFASAGGTTGELTILSDGVPAAFEGRPYTARIRTTGGSEPVTYAITDGAPAPGLTLGTDGVLSGTPTASGAYTFTVTVTDGVGEVRTATFTQPCGTCLVNPDGLVSFWAADGNARDRVGGRDGYAYGNAFGAGVSGQAFDFTAGGTIYAHSPEVQLDNTFTIEFWVNPTGERASTPESTTGNFGVSQRFAIGPNYRYSSSQANMAVSVGTNGISVFEFAYSSYLPSLLVYDAPISGWTHVAVVYRNNRPSLYVNGVHVRDGLQSSRDVFVSHIFGNNPYSSGQFIGQLDEIGIYNRALTQEEIAAIAVIPVLARCPIR
jgi:hypothetical protein